MNYDKNCWVPQNLTPRIEYINLLTRNILEVTFTKADGTERVMRCTLIEEYLPVHETNTDNPIDFPESSRPFNPDVVRVWDTENNGWRSFRLDSVKSYRVI